MCLDVGDNELAALEAIHLFVEILDHFFTSVTELDIVLNFHKVCNVVTLLLRSICIPNGPCHSAAYSRMHSSLAVLYVYI